MIGYIIRRLLQIIAILVLVTFMVFIVLHILPSDPLSMYMAQNEIVKLPPDKLEALRHDFGFDKPTIIQYLDWLGRILRGELGYSIFLNQKVSQLIVKSFPITAYLGSLAFVFGSILGILFGVICALRRGKWIDTVLTILANMGITLPSFWVGILLIYVFAFNLGWLPVCGFTSPFDDPLLSLRTTIMPVFCLALFSLASLTRQTRSAILEVVMQDYVRTAWSKGLSERVVVFRHILKNSLIPVVTMMGIQARYLIGGTVVIETIFNIPGLGRLLTMAIFGQDYQVVEGSILIIVLVITTLNLLVDISYVWFDPRIRYE